jgi:hypothetical protein
LQARGLISKSVKRQLFYAYLSKQRQGDVRKGDRFIFLPGEGQGDIRLSRMYPYWAKTRREYHVRNKNRWDFPMINPYGYKLIRPTI